MFLGVILFCLNPTDAFSCRVVARTGGLFLTYEQCQTTTSREMVSFAERMKAIARFKCLEVGQAT